MSPRNKDCKLKKVLQKYMKSLNELKFEIDKRQCIQNNDCFRGRRPVCQSPNLPHPFVLEEYTISHCELDEVGRELLDAALCARLKAYVPYSQFRVGAAFRTKCGYIYCGCNVENVAFSPGSCAERTALCKAVSEGHTQFTAGAVVARLPDGFCTPCGVCRQFIQEFASRDFPIYIARAPEQDDAIPLIGDNDEVLVTSAYNLLPHSFTVFK